jgi:anti-sigma regulatory factor (Ser/Thr protein kinase)
MTCLPMSGGASTVRASVSPRAGAQEPDSSAGPAFQPDRERPRHSFLELAATAEAVPRFRRHARSVLHDWGLAAIAETTELLTSELATNAVQASAGSGTPVRLFLVAGYHDVLVQVWDASERMPEQRDSDLDSMHGRGLLMVDVLSARWGAYRSAGVGKVTWCVVEPPRLGRRAVCLSDVARPGEHPQLP